MKGAFPQPDPVQRRSPGEMPARSPRPARASVEPVEWRGGVRWAVTLLLLITLGATFISLVLFQATSEGASKRALRRAVAALSEVDVLIDHNYASLQQQASTAAPGAQFRLPDFPLNVTLTRNEVLHSSKAQMRDLLLNRSADLMYRDGTRPLRSTPGSSASLGMFTVGGITDRGLGFLTGRHHDVLRILTLVLAGISALLCVALAALCRGFARLWGVGAVVLAASLPMLVAGAAARVYIRFASGGQTEYLQREFLAIGRGLAWIPIRDGLACAGLGVVIVIVGVICALWADRTAGVRAGEARRRAIDGA